jgi:hypothetical protein
MLNIWLLLKIFVIGLHISILKTIFQICVKENATNLLKNRLKKLDVYDLKNINLFQRSVECIIFHTMQ